MIENINGWQIIDSYTRANAIEDGFLIPVSELFPSDTRLFKYPVCITRAIWNLIDCKDPGGWVWDLCYMATKSPSFKMLSESEKLYKINLPRKHGSIQTKSYKLLCKVGPGDNAEPVITIMFPGED